MSDAVRSYRSGGAVVASGDAERRARMNRGLRTLERDIAEVKKAKTPGTRETGNGVPPAAPPKPPVGGRAPSAPQVNAPAPVVRDDTMVQRKTSYTAELERLAQKYIPEKQPGGALNAAANTGPSPGALKSFEMNKAFNERLHNTTRVNNPTHETSPSPTPSLRPIQDPALAKELAQKQPTEAGPPPKVETYEPQKAKESNVSAVASQGTKNESDKQALGLIAQNIAAELEEVLKKNDSAHENPSEKDLKTSAPAAEKEPAPAPRRASVKELEAELSDIALRIQSSASRIETYKNETHELERLLKNLYEKRDVINKNLEPIQEKEREILSVIKEFEEKERASTDKIEKRETETKRWEKEAERRELEDERWRLEEIFEKLRSVLERVERERDSTHKKLEEEEKHKIELEAEEHIVRTHRDVLTKENELEKAHKEQKKLENSISNIKETLRTIRIEEEKLEHEKRELEAKSEVLNDSASKRSLEKERRRVEDNLRAIEEKRWNREDALRKVSNEKDEKDRVINLLSSERDSLRGVFEDLKKNKTV